LEKTNGLEAVVWGFRATANDVTQIATLPIQLLRKSDTDAQVLGYKGMYDVYQQFRTADIQAARQDPQDAFPVNTLGFFIMITVSLGVFNLLPLPALDGGRIAIALLELVTRRRMPVSVVNVINLIGFVALMGLLVLINLREWLP